MIQNTIKKYLDVGLFNEKVEAEKLARESITLAAKRWHEVEVFVQTPPAIPPKTKKTKK